MNLTISGKKEEISPNEGNKEKKKIYFYKGIPVSVILAVFVFVAALFSILISNTNTSFEPSQTTIMTFWVSFCIGTVGAGVYLLWLLMNEKDLKVLENPKITDIYLMTQLYLLSGGFVAATVQTSTAILTGVGLHAVFLLGFGWQGAVSGVVSTSIRKDLDTKLENCSKSSKQHEDRANDCAKNSTNLIEANRTLAKNMRDCAKSREEQNAMIEELKEKLSQYEEMENSKTSNFVGT